MTEFHKIIRNVMYLGECFRLGSFLHSRFRSIKFYWGPPGQVFMDELEAYKSDGLDVSNIRFDDNSEASRPGLSRYDLQGTEANRLRCDLHL